MGFALVAEAGLTRDESLTTPERIRATEWWPTRPAGEPTEYAGTAVCAQCHAAIVAEQARSQMRRTLGPAGESSVLAEKLSGYHVGQYSYRVSLSGRKATLEVSDQHGNKKNSDLNWYIGSGDIGQSFLWFDGKDYRETRFNFFRSLPGLDATPGRLSAAPTYFDMAVGRIVEPFEMRSCLSCHTTRFPATGPIAAANVVSGVQCEACHGPGAAHVKSAQEHAAAIKAGKAAAPWDRKIFDAARLSPVAAVDSCGACHSTPADVRLMGAAGVQTVRFPAYRLEKSRCWGTSGDARLVCSSCHDPHAPIAHDPAAYDLVCASCHTSAHSSQGGETRRAAAVCPVAKQRCVSCHMPKYLIPEMHARFTDHDIRIDRSGGKDPAD